MAGDIRSWLDGLGLSTYAESFIDNGVDLDLLPELTNEDLKDLGVARLGDRKRILKAIASFDGASSPPSPATPATTPDVPARPQGERRQVSILFADICGYTKLSSEIDAETLHTLLGHFFDRADAIVGDHGGSVDKHVGDSVMAVFGAPVAHSDDPVRAARAAMAIHEIMPEVSDKAGRPLQVHIGIASGQVVASGVGGDTHYTVTGDSVNLASRLTDAAGPGETLMSGAVQAAVADAVDSEDRGALAVKGLAEHVQAFAITGLRASATGGSARPFVGRQAELHQFSGALSACRDTGAGQVVLVRGEAGIGKTRLTEEFEKTALAEGFVCHRSLVLDFGVGKGQDAIRTLLRGLLNISPGGGKEQRAEAAERAISEGLLERSQTVFLNDLLNLPQSGDLKTLFDAMDNAARIRGKRETLAALVRARSAQLPLFLMVEDVHWASPLVLDHLAALTQTVADQRAILVMTSRIEGDPLDQAWRAQTGATPLSTIDLRPLRREDALSLAREYFDATQQFALSCIERADGNPLFLDQLLRSAETSRDEQVPGSVQSIVQARLDALDSLDKQALQAASVLGQRFSLEALRHLIETPQYTCGMLIEKYLVRPQGEDYLFAHALVQEGVYSSLLSARREELHRAAAAWYGESDLDLRAEHLDRANDPGAPAAYLEAAAAQAADLRFETALRLSERGMALAQDAATTYDLTCLRGDTLRNLGATEESISAFELALDSATDDIQRCRALIGMAGGLRISDRQRQALEVLDKAEAAAIRHDLIPERTQIHYLRGNVYFPLGNIEGCLGEHEKALGFARQVGATEDEALALSGLGDAHYLRGHMRSSCQQFRACVDLCRAHGYGRIEVANWHMVGWTRAHLMEFAAALEDALAAARMAAEVSHHRAEALGLMLAGRIELEFGLFADAQQHLDSSLEKTRTMGAGNFSAQSLVVLARLYDALGMKAQARDLSQQSIDLVRDVGMTFIGPTALAVQAGLTEDADLAAANLREAERILDSGCVAHNHMWFAQTAIDHALATDDWDAAEHYAARLESFTREQPLEWSDFMIARGRALAAWGRGGRDDNLVAEIERVHGLATKAGLASAEAALARALQER